MSTPSLLRICAHLIAAMGLALAGARLATAQTLPLPPQAPQPQALTASPPVTLPAEVAGALARLNDAIETAESNIQRLAQVEEDLGQLRIDVETILGQSSELAETLRPQLAAVRSQIEKLGPAPAKDAQAEADAIASERARLNTLASALDGAIKATQLAWVRARQLIEKITILRHSLFAKNLMERLPSPLLPALWHDVANETPAVGNRIEYLARDWMHWAARKSAPLALLAGFVVLLYAGLKYTARRLTGRRPAGQTDPPTFFERAVRVAWTAPLRSLPAILACLVLYGGLDAMELLFPPWTRTAGALLRAVAVVAFVTALVRGVLAPNEPDWRLLALADAPARRLSLLLYAITGIYALDAALTETSRALFIPLALSVVQSFAASAAFALLLIGLLLTPFTPLDSEGAPPMPRHRPRAVKLPLWLIALSILVLALLGYVALARFIAQQVVMTGIVVAICSLLYLAIRAVTRDTQQRRYPVSAMLEVRFGLDAPRRNQLARLSELALTLALIIGAIPLLMLQWGFSSADIRDWFKALVFGMEIGQFRISLARILLGIVLFIALLFATRLLQRWLRERALQQTRIDQGILNSIDTVIGYAGTAVAALLAVSYAGLDITNLAIVAGALSVGIGFGLQSIVNNFVSGLILLIERPIKVGDWIVLGSEQGNVRRISVRATEIETFDRASLIIPNSELITGRVLNWTHRNSMGRVIVRIGVGYDSDPERVMAVLAACAGAHAGVLKAPQPIVAFDNFGDSALEFSLRIYLADISQALAVQSDLRVAILRELRAAKIEIPFKQIDVTLRNGEEQSGLRRLNVQAAGGQAAGGQATGERAPAGNGKRSAGASG